MPTSENGHLNMRKLVWSLLLPLLLVSAPPLHATCTASGTSPSVTICSPSITSVATTFHVSAATLDADATVQAMKIYIDGVSVYSVNAAAIETDLTVSVGTHSMTVKA